MSFIEPYTDTDSVFKSYAKVDVMQTKQALNQLYGWENTMKRDYITVRVESKPTLIFKRNIISIAKLGNRTEIICVGNIVYIASNDYPSVVKQMLN